MNDKINKIKEETKIKKGYDHTLNEKIKTQNEKINELQNRCDLINQNIAYYKKKQKEELLYNYNKEEEIDINKIKENYQEEMSKIKEKQEKLKNKIKEQNIKINTILKYNENLTDKIKETMIEIKDKMSKIINYENNIKLKEIQIYDKINKKNNTLSGRKPFRVIQSNNKKKKIFDYQKYLKVYEEGKNKYRLYTNEDNNIKPKALKEIEELKTDIQQAIKRNELDEKMAKIIIGLKTKNNKKNGEEEEDDLQKFLKKNEEINLGGRYNFYVTEGANLPVPIKVENINKNLYSNY